MRLWNRLVAPPSSGNRSLDIWLTQVASAINQLPPFSISSTTNGPESFVTAGPGTLLIDVGSSNTTFWLKLSGTSSLGWRSVDYT